MLVRHQLGDRTAHRVAHDERRRELELVQHRGGIARAVAETERHERTQSPPVTAVVDREHAIAGVGQIAVGAVPVQVGARHPAVQEHHGGAIAAGVA